MKAVVSGILLTVGTVAGIGLAFMWVFLFMGYLPTEPTLARLIPASLVVAVVVWGGFALEEKVDASSGRSTLPSAWSELLGRVGVDLARLDLTRVERAYESGVGIPAWDDIFRPFHLTRPTDVRVVLLAQGPHARPGVADGLAFSTRRPDTVPLELKPILRSLSTDSSLEPRVSDFVRPTGDLQRWSEQGVLLLNSALTCERGLSVAHLAPWRPFTLGLLRALGAQSRPIAFLAFGSYAAKLISDASLPSRHLAITMRDPAAPGVINNPVGFSEAPFSTANHFLARNGRGSINWR